MKLAELAKHLNISTESIKKFIEDFDLDLGECLHTNFELKPDFQKFALENADFLKKYEEDLQKNKSVEEIADQIHKPVEKVNEVLEQEKQNVFENGYYKSSISSFGIDHKLGGNYQFVYDYFGNKTPLTQRDFIGYRDLFFHISDSLEPFINKDEAKNWGIHKPAGIILYGPPGSGKIFWANKIAEIIGYQFKEVKKHYLRTSFVDGNKTSFNDFLVTMMKEDKVLLFMEDFDEIMADRDDEKSVNSCDEETKEIILHYINKFEEEDLVMVGSANTTQGIEEEVLAPGRFDVLIPVFPPNQQERTEMIRFYMLENLSKEATLYKILERSNADHLPFWQDISSKMKVFSNTMIIDFTQSLKKRIRNQYQQTKNENLKIDQNLLKGALRDASAKLTDEYLNQVAQFINDASQNNYDDFSNRIEALKMELETYKVVEKPIRAIGFQHNEDEKK
ncbi:AAA family ATPase [uncultured Chryseobacterium sp.]|uniref:AAA family ATPase n=1 Tax=uncultured Chryseobacterium sp. TaxID=259322 RepID=UPI0026307A0A|nr:AAA family ATPase [uncultured Chryseobacterium sp.]